MHMDLLLKAILCQLHLILDLCLWNKSCNCKCKNLKTVTSSFPPIYTVGFGYNGLFSFLQKVWNESGYVFNSSLVICCLLQCWVYRPVWEELLRNSVDGYHSFLLPTFKKKALLSYFLRIFLDILSNWEHLFLTCFALLWGKFTLFCQLFWHLLRCLWVHSL